MCDKDEKFDAYEFLNPEVLSHNFINSTQSNVIEPYIDAIIAGKNSYAYDAHTYHTKVPPQGIETLISYYTKENDVVLDPFCGSGMTGLAAIRQKRNIILSDISPAAVFIAKNFTSNYSAEKYQEAISEILNELSDIEKNLYSTKCLTCNNITVQTYTVWSYGLICSNCNEEFILWDVARDERPSVKESKILTEFNCPKCTSLIKKRELKRTKLYPVQIGHRCCSKGMKDSTHSPSEYDIKEIEKINSLKLDKWYPNKKFPIGTNTKQAINHGITSIDKCYTHRALIALSEIWEKCITYKKKEMRPLLAWTFTSLYQRVSVFSEFRFWGGSGNIANYNIPQIMNEQNVFKTFKRKASTIALHLKETKPNTSKRNISIRSATELNHIPNKSIDYIFTDPPFGSNINYSEMNFIWESWLQIFTDIKNEAIVNKIQGKGLAEYEQIMTDSFKEMYRVLKDASWLTIVFHNSSEKIWNSIRNAIIKSGFSISKAQIFDKKHGTFKMFVSNNAVGYDLIIHCQKDIVPKLFIKYETSIESFVKEKMKTSEYIFNFIHVTRDPEIDFRKLYSEWIAQQIVSNNIDVSFDNFRSIVSKFLNHAQTEDIIRL
jgi:DNA modification methylase